MLTEQKEFCAQLLAEAIQRVAPDAGIPLDSIQSLIEIPKDTSFGDLAFPCFVLARALKKAPPLIAKELAAAISMSDSRLKSVTPVGPYLNFALERAAMAGKLLPSILDGSYLAPRQKAKQRVMIEYSQPNTHKAFHVGHTRCASLGDSLIRLIEWVGDDVVAVNYIGDEGTHVARCLWFYLTKFKGEVPKKNIGEFLGELYTQAVNLLELEALTKVALPGITVAAVRSVAPHPKEGKWSVLELDTAEGSKKVVSALAGIKSGEKVLYLKAGLRFNGRVIGAVDKLGVVSEGMILSESEAGLSDNNDLPAFAPASAAIGAEAVEVFAIPGAVPAGETVLGMLKAREAEVSSILKRLEEGEPELKSIWEQTKQWSMEEFYEVYRWLNCRFDHYFFESEFGESSKSLVRQFYNKGVFVESQGTIGADLEKYGLGFAILIKSDGTATYAARDLALAQRKFEEFKVDRAINVVDSAQTLHFQQVFKCLELMGYPQAPNCHHQGYAQVVLPDGKMSSRKGNVILFSALRERLRSKILAEFLEKYRGEWSDEEIETAAHRISLGTIRYGMLNTDNNSLIVFDLDEWTSRSGNTGPYMMYAYARIRSILREVGKLPEGERNWSLLTHETEAELINFLGQYGEVVTRAAAEFSPNLVCIYVYELSKRFNRMYANCSVLRAESEQLKCARAALVEATGMVLKHGLSLLGIETIERM